MRHAEWNRVARADEFEDGFPRAFEIAGREIFVCRAGGEFYAGENICSHADFPLSYGTAAGQTIECVLHRARFDLRTGLPIAPPAVKPIPVFSTRVDRGVVYVRLTPVSSG